MTKCFGPLMNSGLHFISFKCFLCITAIYLIDRTLKANWKCLVV